MASVMTQLSESLQTLVDARLDTIDRMLLGRVPRQDRLAIVREVESQLFDQLHERGEALTRDDVLAVLARLDPPEAYLPEVDTPFVSSIPRTQTSSPRLSSPKQNPGVAKASGILGICSLTLVLLSPLLLGIAQITNSVFLGEILFISYVGLIFVGSVLSIVLAAYGRRSGVWAIVGLVTGMLSLLFSILAGGYLLFIILSV